jgi:acyl-CoA dehydrogenase
MIDFSLAPKTLKAKKIAHDWAEYLRSLTRYYDDHEHEELKEDEKKQIKAGLASVMKALAETGPGDGRVLSSIVMAEERSWGDPLMPSPVSGIGLGNAAIDAVATPEQKARCTLTKLEHKLGIRVSDTASIVLEDCRIPYDNILGSPEIREARGGQAGVLATFDATRPGVAAMALGVARAAMEFTKEKLEEAGYTFPYDWGIHSLSAVQKEVLDMEANLEAARLLVWQAAAMIDKAQRNSLEASMGKAKAGRAATLVCQRCVALLGPLGYSREWLAEKWMRDCKINDIFEGTGQIQMLIVARTILGFNRQQLK